VDSTYLSDSQLWTRSVTGKLHYPSALTKIISTHFGTTRFGRAGASVMGSIVAASAQRRLIQIAEKFKCR
jgi:hypothetical protein